MSGFSRNCIDRLPTAWTRTRRRWRVLVVTALSACVLLFLVGVRWHAPIPAALGLLGAAGLALALRRHPHLLQHTACES